MISACRIDYIFPPWWAYMYSTVSIYVQRDIYNIYMVTAFVTPCTLSRQATQTYTLYRGQ
ncbi:hypothetical protein GGR07_000482 [Bacteroides pyogenes]|nr:hypothetical protein [Bacteroides pyogenes]SUV31980.1 Uncharacterised protein [Bacteroides pyogenes]